MHDVALWFQKGLKGMYKYTFEQQGAEIDLTLIMII